MSKKEIRYDLLVKMIIEKVRIFKQQEKLDDEEYHILITRDEIKEFFNRKRLDKTILKTLIERFEALDCSVENNEVDIIITLPKKALIIKRKILTYSELKGTSNEQETQNTKPTK